MIKGFQGADRWWPIDYKKDWAVVRDVAKASGQAFTREAFEKEKARAEAAKKRAEDRLAKPTPDIDFERARVAMMKALIRLQVASRARTRA